MAGARVAVIGATGLVGREIVGMLAERRFPIGELHLYASERSAGEEVELGDQTVRVERLGRELPPLDVVFLCTPAEVARDVGEDLAAEGALVIDLSTASRSDPAAPLLVAGASPEELSLGADRGIVVAVPDPLALLVAAVLRPLATLVRLRRVAVTALESASVFGAKAVEGLARASAALLSGVDVDEQIAVHSALAFSCAPEKPAEGAIDPVSRDLRRLLGSDVAVQVVRIRVPAFHGNAVSLSVAADSPLSLEAVREQLREAPSILLDDPEGEVTASRDAVGTDAVHVGAVHLHPEDPSWVSIWAASDNLRQGGALNAVALAEALLRARQPGGGEPCGSA